MPVSYSAATNTITIAAYTELAPCTCQIIYNADKAGTLSIHARAGIVAVDGAGVAVDRALRPADYVVLGGASADLYITITNWNLMTNATIRVTGTDRDGAAQTDDIAVNANGNFNTAKWFATVTHTHVTVFNTPGGGSFDYDLIQGQWGVFWKLQEMYFSTANIQANTWLVDSIMAFQLGTSGTPLKFTSTTDGTLSLAHAWWLYYQANLFTPIQGDLLFNGSIWNESGSASQPALYGDVTAQNSYLRIKIFAQSTGLLTVRDSVFDHYGSGGGTYIYSPTLPDIDGWTIKGALGGITVAYGYSPTLKNAVFENNTRDVTLYDADSNITFVNCTFDDTKLLFQWTSNYLLDKKEFDLRVVNANGVGIPSATVIIEDKDGNAITGSPFTTDANGDIATQEITHRRFDGSADDAMAAPDEIVYSPFNVIIGKPGYVLRTIVYTMDHKREEIEKLGGAAPHGMEYRRRRVPGEVSTLTEHE